MDDDRTIGTRGLAIGLREPPNQIPAPANDHQPKRPPETVAFLGIDYDEGKTETYRGVRVSIFDENHKPLAEQTFGSWDAACLYAEGRADKIFYLSSVDHFKADGGLA